LRGDEPSHSNSRRRFIPARAGNARKWSGAYSLDPVHPRACGERVITPVSPTKAGGSSPRVRGTLARNALHNEHEDSGQTVHPRACGEREIRERDMTSYAGSSPRVRGTRKKASKANNRRRFIPARAGNAAASSVTGAPGAVHPRACGEREKPPLPTFLPSGSSPRVRGTQSIGYLALYRRRFIPALDYLVLDEAARSRRPPPSRARQGDAPGHSCDRRRWSRGAPPGHRGESAGRRG
jgi:hypothetical protein